MEMCLFVTRFYMRILRPVALHDKYSFSEKKGTKFSILSVFFKCVI
jgi:hypothetical protein